MAGVKETTELLKALIQIGVVCVERFKDGVDWSDAIAITSKIATDSEFRKVIADALEGMDKIGDEMKDISTEELVAMVASFIPDVLDLLGKIKN